MKVIVEAGTCAGSVQWAHEAVEAAADAGAWGFKTQILSPRTLVTRDAPRYDLGNGTQYESFKGQIARSSWASIKAHCDEVDLEFFASCWDFDAVDLCEELEVNWYKVGSGDITYHPILEYIAETGKGVMLSTGASTDDEIKDAVAFFPDVPFVLMACTLSYPCEPEDAALYRISEFITDRMAFVPWVTPRLGWYGYSDHTTLIDIGGLAVAAGAHYLEKHFTVTPGAGGDHDFALNPPQLADYIDHAQRAFRLKFPVHLEDEVLPVEEDARRLARRSLHAKVSIPAGTAIVVGDNAAFVRPTGGIEPNDELISPLVAAVDIAEGEPIAWDLTI